MSRLCSSCSAAMATGNFCPSCGARNDSQPVAAPDPLIGRTLAGRYRIDRRIKAGGMGCVYGGTQLLLDREVAIKCILPELMGAEQVVERFMAEARSLSRLNHPNVVSVYDFGRDDSGDTPQLFMVMEFLRGTELMELMCDGALSVSRTVEISKQILGGLAEAHEHGITHRDLKPENVILEPLRGNREQIKLIDFGIAKVEANRKMTMAGQMIGTPYYMAPEVVLGKPATHLSDLYSFGVVLFEMLTGELPYDSSTPDVYMSQQITQEAPDPRGFVDHARIPVALSELCRRCLTIDPEQRYPDAESVAIAIGSAMNSWTPADDSLFPKAFSSNDVEPDPRLPVCQATVEIRRPDSGFLRRVVWAPELVEEGMASVVWGPVGTGRSWLLRQAREHAEAAGTTVVAMEAMLPPAGEVGYAALGELLVSLSGRSEKELLRLELGEVSTEVLEGVGMVYADDLLPRPQRSQIRQVVCAAFRWALLEAQQASPEAKLLLAIDDFDMIDSVSRLAVTDYLLEEPLGGVAVLLTSHSPLSGAIEHRVANRELRAIDPHELEGVLGENARGLSLRDGASVEPLYVEQMQAWNQNGAEGRPPSTLNGLIEWRIQLLASAQLRALQAAAVRGTTSVEGLLELLGPCADALGALAVLVDLGLMVIENGRIRATHQIIADTALSLAPTGAIERLHQRAAELLERAQAPVELYAYHAIRGVPDVGAFLMVEECARLRELRGDLEGSIAILRDGIEAGRKLMMRGDAEIASNALMIFGRKLGAVLLQSGRIDEAEGVLTETLDLTVARSSFRASVLEQLVTAAQLRRQFDRAQKYLDEASAIAEYIGDGDMMARLKGQNRELRGGPSSFEAVRRDLVPVASVSSIPAKSTARMRVRLLVVEDDRALSRAMGRGLRERGFSVETVSNCDDALHRPGPFACAVCDISLPDGDGIKLAEELLGSGKVAKVVFFTGERDPAVRRAAEELGQFVLKGDGLGAIDAVVGAVRRVSQIPAPYGEEDGGTF